MTQSRKKLVSLEATPYYHCMSRCVRRAFLCGRDSLTGRDFSHRKGWFEERLRFLQSVFAVDIAAFAIMSNHYHLVVFIDAEAARQWTMQEVINRWCLMYKGPLCVQKYRAGHTLSETELEAVRAIASVWRERLMNLSWFMGSMNEYIARKANHEDGCTGSFWDRRFKSQALLDEKAILSCMAYVDLNPVRAKISKSPEASAHTSIQQRIAYAALSQNPNQVDQQPKQLLAFVGGERLGGANGIQFHLSDYLALVDWTGRQMQNGKRGYIESHVPPLLERLGIKGENWITLSTSFEKKMCNFAGSKAAFNRAKTIFRRLRMPGIAAAVVLFGA